MILEEVDRGQPSNEDNGSEENQDEGNNGDNYDRYNKNKFTRKCINRDDNRHENKKFTSVGRRKILLPVIAGVVFFAFLLSGTETYDVSLLLQQELDWPTSGSTQGIFGTAYASDEETSITEEVNENDESDEGDQAKAFDVSDDDNGNDNTDDIDVSNDNDVADLKERPGWDPNDFKESESDIQNSVKTEPDDIGSSELQHCIGCSETGTEAITGDDQVVMLPLGGVPLPAEGAETDTGFVSLGWSAVDGELTEVSLSWTAQHGAGIKPGDVVSDPISGDDSLAYFPTVPTPIGSPAEEGESIGGQSGEVGTGPTPGDDLAYFPPA